MSAICTCSGEWGNLGKPGCFGEAGEFLHGVFATELKADGSKNCVQKAAAVDLAYFDAIFKNEAMQDRWLLQENISKITPITEDDITDTSNPLKSITLSKGKRGFTFSVVCKDPNKLAKKYESLACNDLVFYAITDLNNLVGKCDVDDLCGRKIARLTTSVLNKSTQNGQAGELLITVEFEITELDEDVDFITPAADEDLRSRKGLIDVETQNLASTINQATFELVTSYGSKNGRVAAQGLTATEIEIFNINDAAAIVLSGPITYSNGVYTAPYTTPQDLADVVRVQGIGGTVKKIYDLKLVDDTTAIIA